MRTLTWEGIEFGNFILIASIHLWNQSIENVMSSSPLGCDFVTSLVKRSVAKSVPDRASVHTTKAAFEAVSAPEQYCSAPLLKVERSVSDRFLKRSELSLNILSEQKLQRDLVLVNNLFKSNKSVANCMMDRAPVHTGNASEQFLHRNRTLIFVHTVPEQLLKRSKTYPIQCEHSLTYYIMGIIK